MAEVRRLRQAAENRPITIPELLTDIREHGVPDFGLASTTQTLILRMEAFPSVIALKKHARAGYTEEAVRRSWAIMRTPAPEGYAHPDDLELAALLWILHQPGEQRDRCSVAFSMICFNMPDCFFWAPRVMEKTPDYEERAAKNAAWRERTANW